MNATAESSTIVTLPKRGPQLVVWGGFLIVFTGAISYFLYFSRFPTLRDFPLLNLPVVVIGLALAIFGAFKVFAQGSGLAGKALASVGVLLATAITGLFNFYIFSLSYQMPEAAAAPASQQPAPDFALLDHSGQTVRLSDHLGKKVVLVFYRGYW